ncbi:MAG: hypothetical protein ACRD16_05900 [Thermoanaerobaculia bacterium]
MKDHTHPRNIYAALTGQNKDMKFNFALAALSHLRDNSRLTTLDVKRLSQGTYLRQEALDQVLNTLVDLGLISSPAAKKGAQLRKNLFPEKLKVGR